MRGVKNEGMVRVRVLCKDAMKIEESAMVYINRHGYMIKWKSAKLEEHRKTPLANNTKFNRQRDDKEDSDDEADKEEDSCDSHDSGFDRLGREKEEEVERKRNMDQADVDEQRDDEREIENDDFDLSQTKP
jgi:acyl transferase domain-containing protein